MLAQSPMSGAFPHSIGTAGQTFSRFMPRVSVGRPSMTAAATPPSLPQTGATMDSLQQKAMQMQQERQTADQIMKSAEPNGPPTPQGEWDLPISTDVAAWGGLSLPLASTAAMGAYPALSALYGALGAPRGGFLEGGVRGGLEGLSGGAGALAGGYAGLGLGDQLASGLGATGGGRLAAIAIPTLLGAGLGHAGGKGLMRAILPRATWRREDPDKHAADKEAGMGGQLASKLLGMAKHLSPRTAGMKAMKSSLSGLRNVRPSLKNLYRSASRIPGHINPVSMSSPSRSLNLGRRAAQMGQTATTAASRVVPHGGPKTPNFGMQFSLRGSDGAMASQPTAQQLVDSLGVFRQARQQALQTGRDAARQRALAVAGTPLAFLGGAGLAAYRNRGQ